MIKRIILCVALCLFSNLSYSNFRSQLKHIRTGLHQKPVRFSFQSRNGLHNAIAHKFIDGITNGLVLSYDGMCKAVLSAIVCACITNKDLVTVGNYSLTTCNCADYGVHALWISFWDGCDHVPRALTHKFIIDVCYNPCVWCADSMGIDYPQEIKDTPIAYAICRMAAIYITRRMLASCADYILGDEQEIEIK